MSFNFIGILIFAAFSTAAVPPASAENVAVVPQAQSQAASKIVILAVIVGPTDPSATRPWRKVPAPPPRQPVAQPTIKAVPMLHV